MKYLLDYGIVIIVYCTWICPVWTWAENKQTIRHLVMLIYILAVCTVTVFPLPLSVNGLNKQFLFAINVIPFRDIIYGYSYAKREALLNVCLFIPFGFLLPFFRHHRLLMTTTLTCLFSLTIETIQLITVLFHHVQIRVVDITDLITNTIGGTIGYSLYVVYQRIRYKNISY